jgi:hypothetical protein
MQPAARSKVLYAGIVLADAIALPVDAVQPPGLLTLAADLEEALVP